MKSDHAKTLHLVNNKYKQKKQANKYTTKKFSFHQPSMHFTMYYLVISRFCFIFANKAYLILFYFH